MERNIFDVKGVDQCTADAFINILHSAMILHLILEQLVMKKQKEL